MTRNGLPRPSVNAWIELPADGMEVDFHWPTRRLIVEVDGYRFHSSRWAFERDRLRGQKLAAAGFRLERFTWRQLAHRPGEIVATLRALLAPAL